MKKMKRLLTALVLAAAAPCFAQTFSENVSDNASELSQTLLPLEVFFLLQLAVKTRGGNLQHICTLDNILFIENITKTAA